MDITYNITLYGDVFCIICVPLSKIRVHILKYYLERRRCVLYNLCPLSKIQGLNLYYYLEIRRCVLYNLCPHI